MEYVPFQAFTAHFLFLKIFKTVSFSSLALPNNSISGLNSRTVYLTKNTNHDLTLHATINRYLTLKNICFNQTIYCFKILKSSETDPGICNGSRIREEGAEFIESEGVVLMRL